MCVWSKISSCQEWIHFSPDNKYVSLLLSKLGLPNFKFKSNVASSKHGVCCLRWFGLIINTFVFTMSQTQSHQIGTRLHSYISSPKHMKCPTQHVQSISQRSYPCLLNHGTVFDCSWNSVQLSANMLYWEDRDHILLNYSWWRK